MGSLGAEVAKRAAWLYPKIVGFNPSERWGHSACYSNGLVYVFGGCCGGLHFSDVLVLNLKTMIWSALVTKGCGPRPRDSHSALLWENKMIIFGGIDGLKKVNDLHILDLESNEWIRPICRGEPPSPRESHTATLIDDGSKLVIFGGSGEGVGNYLNDLHFLDLKTMTWSSPPLVVLKGTTDNNIPSPRDSHVCVSVGNDLFLFGGDSGDRYHGDVHRLDLHTLIWTKLAIDEGSSPGARAGHAAVSVGSKIYVTGGVGDKKYYNDAWCFDCETSSWSKLDVCGELPQGRFSHTAVFADSDIIIYGGCGEDERPLKELLILQLGARHPNGRYNISLLCKNFGNKWLHHYQGRKRVHPGEDRRSLKTMILGIEIEAQADERETHPKRRSRTITNRTISSCSTSRWDNVESEPEEHSHSHSHSLSIISQHSSPSQSRSQSDQEQQTTAKTNSPTSSSPVPNILRKCSPRIRNCTPTTIKYNHLPPNYQKPKFQQHRPDNSLLTAEEGSCGQDGGRVHSMIGAEVQGKVDGAFDSGYLMTAVVNGKVFRGVLFSPVPNVVHRRIDIDESLACTGGNAAPPSSPHNMPLNSVQPMKKRPADSSNNYNNQTESPLLSGIPLQLQLPSSPSTTMGRDSREQASRSDLRGIVLTLGGPGSSDGSG